MKTLALAPWQLFPTISGGQERCFNLLSRIGEVTVFSLNWEGREDQRRVGQMNYRSIPADAKAVEQSRRLIASGLKTYDPMPMLTKNNLTTIRKAIDDADPDMVILEHPWLLDLIGDRPYIYDSHNCEAQNTADQFGRGSYDYDLVKDLERRAIQGAEHMIYTTKRDHDTMKAIYSFETPSTLVPNGTDLPATTSDGTTNNLIFIGSMYGPNVEAARELVALAPLLPQWNIQILGACANMVTTEASNVELVGMITDKQRDHYFNNAYAFINLISRGSGSHLKIARALAHGLPVITTTTGARGYTGLLETTPAGVPDMLDAIKDNWKQHSSRSLDQAEQLSWEHITKTFNGVLNAFQ
jgi:hypothetical protein